MILKKNKYELIDQYKIRKKFIELSKPINKKEYVYLENLSFIFINMVFLKCRYQEETEKNIISIINSSNSRNLKKLFKKKIN